MARRIIKDEDKIKNRNDIIRLVENFPAWAEENIQIIDKETQELISFVFNEGQEILHAEVLRQVRLTGGAYIILLKSRRFGGSTYVSIFSLYMALMRDHCNCVVLAHNEKPAQEIFDDIYMVAYESLEPLPKVRRKTKDKIFFKDGDCRSKIYVLTADNSHAARSFAIHVLHASEYAMWKKPAKTMMAIKHCLTYGPGRFIFIESTAQGRGNDFHTKWQKAVEGFSNYSPVFVPWWKDRTCSVPIEGPMANPRSTNEEEAVRISELGAREGIVLTDDEKRMVELYDLTLEQVNWYRWASADTDEKDENEFRQEFPADPDEAFSASSACPLDKKWIKYYLDRTDFIEKNGYAPDKDTDVLMRQGDILGTTSTPDEHSRSMKIDQMEFVERHDHQGNLKIFIEPNRNKRYIVAVDTAGGGVSKKADYSVIQVLERGHRLRQAAIYRARSQSYELGMIACFLGHFYRSGDDKLAYLVPEVNLEGFALFAPIKALGYPVNCTYYEKDFSRGFARGEVKQRFGFKTDSRTRPLMFTELERLVRTGLLEINDLATARELSQIVVKNRKWQHDLGCHDDTVIPLAIAALVDTYQQTRDPLPPREDVTTEKLDGHQISRLMARKMHAWTVEEKEKQGGRHRKSKRWRKFHARCI
jgi:hypothetical protein